MKTAMNHWKY